MPRESMGSDGPGAYPGRNTETGGNAERHAEERRAMEWSAVGGGRGEGQMGRGVPWSGGAGMWPRRGL